MTDAMDYYLGQAGRQAVTNGKAFQRDVCSRLERLGYTRLSSLPPQYMQPFYIEEWHSPYPMPYGTMMRADFYLWHPLKYPDGLVIACKYQEKRGSVDEKLYYALGAAGQGGLLNLTIPSVLVIIGPGASRRSRQYCKAQETRLLKVITSSDEWMILVNRGLF